MVNHRNKWIKFIIAFVLAFCFMTFWQIPTMAADTNGISTELIISQDFQVKRGKQPSAGAEFNYQLTALTADNPMPEGTDETGVYHFKLDGKSEITIRMDYAHAGFYQYQIEPVIEKEQTGYTYDKSIYVANIHVKNSQAGLITTIVITDSNQDKVDEIVYEHSYVSEESLAKTGDSARPMLYVVICCASMILLIFAMKMKLS